MSRLPAVADYIEEEGICPLLYGEALHDHVVSVLTPHVVAAYPSRPSIVNPYLGELATLVLGLRGGLVGSQHLVNFLLLGASWGGPRACEWVHHEGGLILLILLLQV